MRKSMYLKQNNGVTLVEIIIAVAFLSIVISIGYMLYFTGFKAFDRNIERVDLQQNVRHSLSYITKRLQNANEASVSVTTIDQASDELRIGNELFRLTGLTLRVNHDHLNPQSPFNPLSEGITGFEAIRDGRSITVTITAGTAQQSNLFTLSSSAILRR